MSATVLMFKPGVNGANKLKYKGAKYHNGKKEYILSVI